MEDIRKIVGGFFALILALYVLSTLAEELPTPISNGFQFGPLIVGAFVFYAIVWFIKEVMGK